MYIYKEKDVYIERRLCVCGIGVAIFRAVVDVVMC